MSIQMIIQAPTITKQFLAKFTGENSEATGSDIFRFHMSVNEMELQVLRIFKNLATLGTELIWILDVDSHHVAFQAFLLIKSCSTHVTQETPFVQVYQLMIPPVMFKEETLFTMTTLVGFFTQVYPFVHLQAKFLSE